MAAMLTALTEFSTSGNSRTYTTTGHTASKPKIVVQRRRVPSGNQIVSESVIDVVQATTDADNAIVSQKISMSVTVKYPTSGQQADIDAVRDILRDIVGGDEFANTVNTQEFLK